MPVDPGTLPRVDPGQFGAVGGRDRRADRTVALSYTGAVTQTACWEERSQVCDEIRLTLAEVRRRTPSAVPAWGPRGTTPRLTVRGTAAGAPPPPPPPPHSLTHSLTHSRTHVLMHSLPPSFPPSLPNSACSPLADVAVIGQAMTLLKHNRNSTKGCAVGQYAKVGCPISSDMGSNMASGSRIF